METQFLMDYLQEFRSQPPPPDRRPLGCLLMVAAGAGFLLFPALAGTLGLPAGAGRIGLVVFAVVLVLGVGLRLLGSGNRYGRVLQGIEEATGPQPSRPSTPGRWPEGWGPPFPGCGRWRRRC